MTDYEVVEIQQFGIFLTPKGFKNFMRESKILAKNTKPTKENRAILWRNLYKLAKKWHEIDKPQVQGIEITKEVLK